ncbi:MAG: type II toxin-antitoxin system HicA family toxin [Rudaea sp.]
MVRLRVFSGRELCRLLGEHGFEQVSQRGSHAIMRERTEGTTVTVPVPLQ